MVRSPPARPFPAHPDHSPPKREIRGLLELHRGLLDPPAFWEFQDGIYTLAVEQLLDIDEQLSTEIPRTKKLCKCLPMPMQTHVVFL